MTAGAGRESTVVAAEADAGLRLDVWLSRALPGLSRARVQALIRQGDVRVENRPARAHLRVAAGLRVIVFRAEPAPAPGLAAEDIALDVLHEDGELIVVNKPPGLVVHPAAGHASGTLVNALLHRCRDLAGIGGELRPGIVHRLDRDTSGVMVAAKTERALNELARQFKAREVRKIYLALVLGVPSPPQGRIETLIGRSRHDRKKMSATPHAGREASTVYEVVEDFGEASLVRLRLETGRTHQIRVHMAHIGCPVAGDRQYAGRHRIRRLAAPRQMLHAEQLSFTHPLTGERLTFVAPLPADMAAILGACRAGNSCADGGAQSPAM